MENFYREVYRIDGVTDIKFPEHYPVSVLLGSVKVAGCLKLEEFISWEAVPQGVRLEGQTEFCWLCEEPQKLVVPFQMRGWLKVYNLEKKIAANATRGLRPVIGPAPVKFPPPDSSDPRSLKPGSLENLLSQTEGKAKKPATTPSLDASIAGARKAANQFRKDWSGAAGSKSSSIHQGDCRSQGQSRNDTKTLAWTEVVMSNQGPSTNKDKGRKNQSIAEETWVRKA
ncbi:hypothetical protein KP509_26G012200 [Ceratopteris richardii]|nr:hypothetical protein KP509_26G012200 [Ceratopteris richardii]